MTAWNSRGRASSSLVKSDSSEEANSRRWSSDAICTLSRRNTWRSALGRRACRRHLMMRAWSSAAAGFLVPASSSIVCWCVFYETKKYERSEEKRECGREQVGRGWPAFIKPFALPLSMTPTIAKTIDTCTLWCVKGLIWISFVGYCQATTHFRAHLRHRRSFQIRFD